MVAPRPHRLMVMLRSSEETTLLVAIASPRSRMENVRLQAVQVPVSLEAACRSASPAASNGLCMSTQCTAGRTRLRVRHCNRAAAAE